MSESSSEGGEENHQLIHPIMLNAFKEMIRKNMEEDFLIEEQRERLMESKIGDASSSSSTAVTKNETFTNDDMKESKEKNNGLFVAKENDEEGNMNAIQSNDSIHELEESFVMVESFTSTTTSPKTARFELVEKDEHLRDGNAKQQQWN